MPAWLVAPGLLVPPIFLPIILCLVDHATAPAVPLPVLDAREATAFLQTTGRAAARRGLGDDEVELVDSWRALVRAELAERRAGESTKTRLAQAQQAMRDRCKAVAAGDELERVLAAGTWVAHALVRAVVRLEVAPEEAERDAAALGGAFLESARASGLVDRRGRLRAHPIVPYALVQLRWRSACGLQPEEGMTPLELDGVDVFRIRFGRRLAPATRLAAVRRFSDRHRSFPREQALTALLLEAGDPVAAAEEIRPALARSPGNLALRSYLLHAQEALE